MLLQSKFDPATNPIGTQNLEVVYLEAADNFVTAQLYANVILQQPPLDISQLDAGLATSINAFQARMKNSANFFQSKLIPGFIMSAVDGAGFCTLIESWSSLVRTDVLNSYQDAGSAKNASTMTLSLASQADDISVDVNSLNASFTAGNASINTFSKNYDTDLTNAINLLSDNAKQVSASIDELQAAIAQNINDIVEGEKELGNAITQLGTGILTMISGAATDPSGGNEDGDGDGDGGEDDGDGDDKKNDDKKNDGKKDNKAAASKKNTKTKDKAKNEAAGEGGEAPNVEFAVQSIQVGTSGQAKASEAMAALKMNNDKLAAAYQRLAQENVLVAIAKVTQVQNKLFLDTYNQIGLNIHELNMAWTAVETAYSDLGNSLTSLQSQSEAIDYATEVQGARSLWRALNNQFTYIKNSLTGS